MVFQLKASSSRSDIERWRAASIAAGAASGSRTKSELTESGVPAVSLDDVTRLSYRAWSLCRFSSACHGEHMFDVFVLIPSMFHSWRPPASLPLAGTVEPMRALVLDSSTAGFDALLERRRRSGLARLDEVWAGVLHMIPAPSLAHARIAQQLAELLGPLARGAMHEFNLGDSEADFRVPDGALHRPGAHGTWLSTAALVVEIVSPGDETWEKLPFYASHNVDEVLIVDPLKRTVTWLGLAGESYSELSHSSLLELDAEGLAQQIEWPSNERDPQSPTPVQRS